jgi:hypothetical protein
MALIAVAADKGSPGVTTSAVVLAAVWPRPVLLAECDPAGGDLAYWFPAADGGRLDRQRGLLSLAVAARRGAEPGQVWDHTQKLPGGLDVLSGVTTAEQGAGLEPLWPAVGWALSRVPRADVIADCGRIGADGPFYDLLAQAAAIVLMARDNLGEIVRLRERAAGLAAGLGKRSRAGMPICVMVMAEHKRFHSALAEVGQALGHGKGQVNVIGGLAYDPKSARALHGEWGGRLDRSLLARTARDVASHLAVSLPALPAGPGRPRAAIGGAPGAGLATPGALPAPGRAPTAPGPDRGLPAPDRPIPGYQVPAHQAPPREIPARGPLARPAPDRQPPSRDVLARPAPGREPPRDPLARPAPDSPAPSRDLLAGPGPERYTGGRDVSGDLAPGPLIPAPQWRAPAPGRPGDGPGERPASPRAWSRTPGGG